MRAKNAKLSLASLIILAILLAGSHRLEDQVVPPGPADSDRSGYDVIVVGGEPEGVAAAIAAVRQGGRVLLLEHRDGLGGLMTFGMLNSIDMNKDPQGELLNRGIFAEFFEAVGGDSFDVKEAKEVFRRMVQEDQDITLLLNTRFEKALLNEPGTAIIGVEVTREGQAQRFFAPRVVDATQDADVAASAGVPYTLGSEDIGISKAMAQTLVFGVGGVDWQEVSRFLNRDNDRHTGANEVSGWGFGREMKDYQPYNPRIRMRGLNLGRQQDGTVLINALHIFGVNGLDKEAKKEAIALATRELPRIVKFLRSNIAGFANAYLAVVAPELYIRQTRQITGEYTLSILDVLENRDFPDRIAHGSYPVDIQSTSPENHGFIIGAPQKYSIPFRCLVPLKVDNLLVVGRSASFSSLAMGSARVIPVGMATGQAAGVASVYSLRENITPRDLSRDAERVAELQRLLTGQGVYLKAFSLPNPWAGHWAYPYLQALLSLGVVSGGYENNWRLDEPMPEQWMVEMSLQIFGRRAPAQLNQEALVDLGRERGLLTAEKALMMLMVMRGEDPHKIRPEDLYEHFVTQGWLSQNVQSRWLPPGQPITVGLAYALKVETLRQLGVLPAE